MADNKVYLTYGYNGTDFTRQYVINNVADSIAADTNAIKNKILAVNESLSGGTAGGLSEFFRSDDYDGNIGTFKAIVNAKLETVVETDIPKPVSRQVEFYGDEEFPPYDEQSEPSEPSEPSQDDMR